MTTLLTAYAPTLAKAFNKLKAKLEAKELQESVACIKTENGKLYLGLCEGVLKRRYVQTCFDENTIGLNVIENGQAYFKFNILKKLLAEFECHLTFETFPELNVPTYDAIYDDDGRYKGYGRMTKRMEDIIRITSEGKYPAVYHFEHALHNAPMEIESEDNTDWKRIDNFDKLKSFISKAKTFKTEDYNRYPFVGFWFVKNGFKVTGTDGRMFYLSCVVPCEEIGEMFVALDKNEVKALEAVLAEKKDDPITDIFVALNRKKSAVELKVVTQNNSAGDKVTIQIKYLDEKRLSLCTNYIGKSKQKLRATARFNVKQFAAAYKCINSDTAIQVEERDNGIAVGKSVIPAENVKNFTGSMFFYTELTKIFKSKKEYTDVDVFEAIVRWNGDDDMVISLCETWKEPPTELGLSNESVNIFEPVLKETEPMAKKTTTANPKKVAKKEPAEKAIRKKIVEKCGKEWTDNHVIIMTPKMEPPKPEPPKKKTEPAQAWTFSVDNSLGESLTLTPTESDYTEVKTNGKPVSVELKRKELGDYVANGEGFELYKNETLQRYRLAFSRHLKMDERKWLYDNGWAWRKEYKCYQWGLTKNGQAAVEKTLARFK